MPLTPGVERAAVATVAAHRRNHPKHAHRMVRQMLGLCKRMDRDLNDDPALAVYQLKQLLPALIGIANQLLETELVVEQCEPHEVPTKGARLCN